MHKFRLLNKHLSLFQLTKHSKKISKCHKTKLTRLKQLKLKLFKAHNKWYRSIKAKCNLILHKLLLLNNQMYNLNKLLNSLSKINNNKLLTLHQLNRPRSNNKLLPQHNKKPLFKINKQMLPKPHNKYKPKLLNKLSSNHNSKMPKLSNKQFRKAVSKLLSNNNKLKLSNPKMLSSQRQHKMFHSNKHKLTQIKLKLPKYNRAMNKLIN